jgi:hypothetical protein
VAAIAAPPSPRSPTATVARCEPLGTSSDPGRPAATRPGTAAIKAAEFATIRLRLIKVAARIIETASRNRIAFASACPDAALFRTIALSLKAAAP